MHACWIFGSTNVGVCSSDIEKGSDAAHVHTYAQRFCAEREMIGLKKVIEF